MSNVSKHFFLAYSALKNKGCKTLQFSTESIYELTPLKKCNFWDFVKYVCDVNWCFYSVTSDKGVLLTE